ncbi:hypothetical protein M231_08091 [Tremella mesenterica]|uniref:Uncharacterized protein n=1 Tax=Tremella mesenterica TaxID=5217 RepID=A0A4Q1B7V0_TREME|nr:hypothetical protein M231_08091 [Tremella mesenterica]
MSVSAQDTNTFSTIDISFRPESTADDYKTAMADVFTSTIYNSNTSYRAHITGSDGYITQNKFRVDFPSMISSLLTAQPIIWSKRFPSFTSENKEDLMWVLMQMDEALLEAYSQTFKGYFETMQRNAENTVAGKSQVNFSILNLRIGFDQTSSSCLFDHVG